MMVFKKVELNPRKKPCQMTLYIRFNASSSSLSNCENRSSLSCSYRKLFAMKDSRVTSGPPGSLFMILLYIIFEQPRQSQSHLTRPFSKVKIWNMAYWTHHYHINISIVSNIVRFCIDLYTLFMISVCQRSVLTTIA
jgi:hypothetical protein